jgi:hypothetical protein
MPGVRDRVLRVEGDGWPGFPFLARDPTSGALVGIEASLTLKDEIRFSFPPYENSMNARSIAEVQRRGSEPWIAEFS